MLTSQVLAVKVQHDTRAICEVNAGHVFHFARAQSPKGGEVPGK